MPVSKHRNKKKGKKPQSKGSRVITGSRDFSDYPVSPMSGSALLVRIDNSRTINNEMLKKLALNYGISDQNMFLSEMQKPDSNLHSIMHEVLDESTIKGTEHQHKVLRDYYSKLVRIYGKSKKELMQMNIIDTRNLGKMLKANAEAYSEEAYNKFHEKYQFYEYIPCFMTGVLEYEENAFVEWKILEIDEIQRILTIHLMHYYEEGEFWEPGVSATITLDCDHKGVCNISFEDGSNMEYSDIYRIIPMSEFDWIEGERVIFKKLVLKNADDVKDFMRKSDKSAVIELAQEFIHYINGFNFVMSVRKSRTKRKKSNAESHIEWKDDLNPKRRIHYVGILPVKSEKKPIQVTRDTLKKVVTKDVRYKVPAWECRGFYRHLKNGTVQYVRPHIKHRKNYDKNLTIDSTPPHTLIVRDPGEISCEEDNDNT